MCQSTPAPAFHYSLSEADQYHLYRARHLARVLSMTADGLNSYVDLDRESLAVTFGLLADLIEAGDPGYRNAKEV